MTASRGVVGLSGDVDLDANAPAALCGCVVVGSRMPATALKGVTIAARIAPK
jgi:hypothetical protein